MKKSNYAITHTNTSKRMRPIVKILIGIGITIVLICFIFIVTLGIIFFFPPDPEISTDMTEYISEKYVEKDAGEKAKQFLPSYKSLESYTDISYQYVNNDLRCFFSFIFEDFIIPDVFSVTVTYDKEIYEEKKYEAFKSSWIGSEKELETYYKTEVETNPSFPWEDYLMQSEPINSIECNAYFLLFNDKDCKIRYCYAHRLQNDDIYHIVLILRRWCSLY